MPFPPLDSARYLPRLAAEFYRDLAHVFWTHNINGRGVGWLNDPFHGVFREILLHAAVREQLLCPIYVLMPDHFHLLWMGLNAESDQLRANAFLRANLKPHLAPFTLQHQAYDHVLTEAERHRDAFMDTCAYIADNPVNRKLVQERNDWKFMGAVIPGYPTLTPAQPDFWDIFWRVYYSAVKRRSLGKIGDKPGSPQQTT